MFAHQLLSSHINLQLYLIQHIPTAVVLEMNHAVLAVTHHLVLQ